MNTTVLVAGATGYLGRHIVTELARRGHCVHAIVRSTRRATQPGAHGSPTLDGMVDRWIELDITAPGAATNLCADVTHVVSALGVTRQPASPWDVDFRSNIALLSDAEAHGVKTFQYINVMNADKGASLITRAKTAFVQALTRSCVSAQVMNPSGYFSDMTEILEMARRGIAVIPPYENVRISPIHGSDLASVCADRLMGDAGQWDIGGPEALTFREVAELAFEASGRKPRIVRLPERLLRGGVWSAHRMSPRAGMLAQFFADGASHSAIGPPHGSVTLRDYYQKVQHASP